jgi:trigger factor
LHLESSNMSHNCINVSITKDEKKSEIELKAEIPLEQVDLYRKRALTELGKEVKISGFRSGKVPENVLLKNIGEGKLLERTANIALSEELPLLLATEKIPAIAAPAVSITKLAPGNPIEFTAKIAVMPEVVLADYKKIAIDKNSKKESVSVSDEDVEETITHLRRERAKIEKIESGTEPAKATEEAQNMQTLELPGLDNSFVQSLGYKDSEDFKVKLKENIKKEKEMHENEKTRVETIEELVEKSTIPVPDVLVSHEIDKMEAQMDSDLSRSGTNLEDYLKQANKTREEVRGDWKEAAGKRAKMQLALAEIAKVENISADKEALEKYVEHAKEHHKDANEMNVRAYYEQSLRNEAVLNWLGELK